MHETKGGGRGRTYGNLECAFSNLTLNACLALPSQFSAAEKDKGIKTREKLLLKKARNV